MKIPDLLSVPIGKLMVYGFLAGFVSLALIFMGKAVNELKAIKKTEDKVYNETHCLGLNDTVRCHLWRAERLKLDQKYADEIQILQEKAGPNDNP